MKRRKLALAHDLSWTPDSSFRERVQPLGAVFSVDLFSPKGGLAELSIDALRVLSAFGPGRTIEEVCSALGAEGEDAVAVGELAESMEQRGFLVADRASEPRRIPPTFLVTAHGCGGTLLRFIFDAHPELACAPPHRFAVPLRQMMQHADQMDAYRAIGLDHHAAIRGVGEALGNVLQLHARLRQKDGWVCASRDHDQVLHFLADAFEGARFVVLTRDPLDATEAAARRFKTDGWHAGRMIELVHRHDSPHLAYAHYWQDVFKRIRAFRATHGHQVHLVRYEDLVKQPKKTLEAVFGFLGLGMPKDLEKTALEQPHEMLEGGWESFRFLKEKTINASHVGISSDWPNELRADVLSVLETEKKAWGY